MAAFVVDFVSQLVLEVIQLNKVCKPAVIYYCPLWKQCKLLEVNGEGAFLVQVVCNQSLGMQISILQCTIAGGQTKGGNEKSFFFVHQHGSYDVT